MFSIILGSGGVPASEGWKNTHGIIGFGWTPRADTNIINSAGVIASDVTASGVKARGYLTGCEFGGDKGLFFGGYYGNWAWWGGSNIVSNTGVIASDVSAVGTARGQAPGVHFGTDQGLIGFGGGNNTMTNKVSNLGVVQSDVTIPSGITNRGADDNACEYGGDKAIFGFSGASSTGNNVTNLISNTGVVAADTAVPTGVTSREGGGGCDWGGDKGIFAYGSGPTNISNLINNVGVVSSDGTGVGTARNIGGSAEYGTDKGIFAYGGSNTTKTNRVSNLGVVASDGQAAGSGKNSCGGCSFGT